MPKTVLITGCSPGGIGHALAKEFHQKGHRVFATARQKTTISDLAALGIETLACEVTEEESLQTLKKDLETLTNGSLDILVNNAGRNYTIPATDITLDEVRTTFETNVFAIMRLTQLLTPLLIHSQGTIVQIGSLAGVMPYVFGSVYNASKAALHAYSSTLRVELAPFGVKVVVVVTGGVKSNIARTHRELPSDSIYLPLREEYEGRQTHSQANAVGNEEYARAVVRQVLEKPGRDTIWEGGKAWLVWFVTTFLPRWMLDRAMSRMFHLWKLKDANVKKLQ